MLNFDEDRFLNSQIGAVSCADALYQVVADRLSSGAENLFFAGAGGAGILMWPAAALLTRRSTLKTLIERPAELVAAGSVNLGARSIVVIPSRSGDTPESLDALRYAKALGACIITFTGTRDSLLGREADFDFTNPVGDENSSESFYLQSLLLALAVMDVRGEVEGHDELVTEIRRIPETLLEAKQSFEREAAKLADQIAAVPYHIITGAGSTWPEAMYYGMCILEEMQWIRTRPVHAADFFHGPLELVEPGVSCLLMKGEDWSRPLVDRVERFVRSYSDRLMLLDTASVAMPGISEQVRALISPVVLATLLERLSAHLEVKRSHPLTTRRYYRAVTY
jgi:fructoselysine-6-phosphate deglycase